MITHSLYEMIHLLKTGLWQGGEVDKLGYIGGAVPYPEVSCNCGLRGLPMSYDTMLEGCELSSQGGGCELLLSQYQPYTGTYALYVLESNLSDRILLLAKLADILAGQRDAYVWSHSLNKRNVFGINRSYQASYSSMRGGSIATPRQSRFFGR